MTARKFFFVCAGVFLLTLSYHLGASTATAQAPGNPIVASIPNGTTVVTANGDIYAAPNGAVAGPWLHITNVFSAGPTPALQESWGQLKTRYAPKSAPVLQAPTNK